MHSDQGFELQSASFAYGPRTVVSAVSAHLAPGSMTALLGPNGSGKTTLLRLLSGVRKPQAGQVLLDGHPVGRMRPALRARRVAVVSQHAEAGLSFPVSALVGLGRAPHTGRFGVLHEIDRVAVRTALHATDTAHLARRAFNELSGGEQRRVILAMALAQDAEYLLLDEPTLHLDLHHQYEFFQLLHRLQRERGLTVLAVLHDLNLAALYFDRLLVMSHGRLVADGPPTAVLHDTDALRVFQAPLAVVTHPDVAVPQVLLRPDFSE